MSACGSKIARKIESTVARERMHEGLPGEEEVGLAPLAYYGSRYRAEPREVAEEFSFGTLIVARDAMP